MKILWISNVTFPEAKSLLKGEVVHKGSGGWMIGAAEALIRQTAVKLYIASVSKEVSKLTFLEGKDFKFILLPYGKGNICINNEYGIYWRRINDEIKPDVVHIHGTEYSHGLSYVKTCGSENVCVSIQGLVSVIKYYSLSGIKWHQLLLSQTPYSILRGGMIRERRDYHYRSEGELGLIRGVNHIIGRTEFDKSHVLAINPKVHYHYCGEILRKEFYGSEQWCYERCTPHTIFVSQAKNVIKGIHMLIKAMPIILLYYRDTTIRIAGSGFSREMSFAQEMRLNDYERYIYSLIHKYNLSDKVVFTGPLDAEQMKLEYLNCNVFVCSSAIENSSNSIGEAQLLGVPVIASYVGGTPDIMKGDEEHLYRFEEVEMLAYKIVRLFECADNIDTSLMYKKASLRHDPKIVIEDLMKIYDKVIYT